MSASYAILHNIIPFRATVLRDFHNFKYKKLFFMPILFGAFLTLIVIIFFRDTIPQENNTEQWRDFVTNINHAVKSKDNNYNILFFLICLQILQVIFGVPFLHLTKVLYGYVFGVWIGAAICILCETLCIVCVVLSCKYITTRTTKEQTDSFPYITKLRRTYQFYPFLICFHAASIPLLSAIGLVVTDSISKYEFISTHFIITLIMSLKDTFLGNFLAHSLNTSSPWEIGIVSALMLFSTVFPTFCTIFLMTHATRGAMYHLQTIQEKKQEKCLICGVEETSQFCECEHKALFALQTLNPNDELHTDKNDACTIEKDAAVN